MRILIVGASGYVGGALWRDLSQRHEVVGTYSARAVPGLRRLDLREEGALREALSAGFELVVHAAGLVDLSAAEQQPELARELNTASVATLRDAVRGTPTRIVLFSTDNVFDGTAEEYTEDSPRGPVNVYGRTKAAAEDALHVDEGHLVVRIPLVYGHSPLADRFLDRFRAAETRAREDVVCAPLYLPSLAPALEQLWDRTGTLHLGGPEVVTRYTLMSRIAEALRLPTRVVPVRNDEAFPPPPRRPARLVLRSSRHDLTGADLAASLEDLARAGHPEA